MSEERVWVTADTHFNHETIIKHCKRPFNDIKEMNEYIITRWNEIIDKKDHVYILGDFAFKDHLKFINVLKGKKHLIIGNHDSMNKECLNRFITVNEQKQIKYKDRFFILSHCPLRLWNDSQRGNIELHGHVHNRCKTYNLSFDIGVDTHNYVPYNMEEIMKMVEEREKEMIKYHRIIVNEKGEKQYFQDDIRYFEFLVNKIQQNNKERN